MGYQCIYLVNELMSKILLTQNGDECMIRDSVGDDEALKMFPLHHVEGVPSGKKYIRLAPQPK